MTDSQKILEEGKRIIEEFSEKLSDVPESEETHYVTNLKNVMLADAKGACQIGFRAKMEKLAPKWSEGYVCCKKMG